MVRVGLCAYICMTYNLQCSVVRSIWWRSLVCCTEVALYYTRHFVGAFKLHLLLLCSITLHSQKPLPVLLNDPRPSTTTSSFRVSPPASVQLWVCGYGWVALQGWGRVLIQYHLVLNSITDAASYVCSECTCVSGSFYTYIITNETLTL